MCRLLHGCRKVASYAQAPLAIGARWLLWWLPDFATKQRKNTDCFPADKGAWYARARLAVGAAVVADLQHRVVPGRGQRVPGVRAIRGPGHEQVEARAPEQQVAALGLLQRLRAKSPLTPSLHSTVVLGVSGAITKSQSDNMQLSPCRTAARPPADAGCSRSCQALVPSRSPAALPARTTAHALQACPGPLHGSLSPRYWPNVIASFRAGPLL